MTITTHDNRTGLSGTSIDHLAIARHYAANPQDWPFAPRFNPRRRWYHRLATEPHGEVWVLSWLPGQGTDLHDHGASVGAFLVISGVLTEHTLSDPESPSALLGSRRFGTGQGRSFDHRHIHQITNTGTQPAVSVHVYSPALREMTRYQLADGRLLVSAVERAGIDW